MRGLGFAATYTLHGLRIDIKSDAAALHEALLETLRYKGADPAEPGASSDLRLHFGTRTGPSSLPIHARLIDRGEDGFERWQSQDGVIYLCHDDSIVEVTPHESTAQAYIHPATLQVNAHTPLFYLITTSLVTLLRARGHFALHAAGLAKDDCGLLLVAPSGNGKSTAALNLVRRGWDYLSDDTVLIHQAAGQPVRALSFRRDFCVDPESDALSPKLKQRRWPSSPSDRSKWRVDVETLYPGRFTPVCIPHIILFPHLTGQLESTVIPLEDRKALKPLMVQSALAAATDRGIAQQHLDILGTLVEQAVCHRLQAGRDLIEHPARLDELLTPLIGGAPA